VSVCLALRCPTVRATRGDPIEVDLGGGGVQTYMWIKWGS
jgi:hypothetical protein